MESQKNLEYEEFLKFWSKLGKVRQKMPFFTKMRFIQNHILRYNLSYSEARVLKFGKYMDRFKSNRGKWDILKDPFWGLNLRVTLYKFFKSLMGANVPDP